MRKLAFLAAGTLFLAGAVAMTNRGIAPAQTAPAAAPKPWKLAAADTADLKGPRQPIFFRHDIHVGVNKTPCQYCHYSVAESNEPGIPSMQTCMGCHLVVSGSDSTHRAEIKKLRDAWNAKQPIEWVRVHKLARHVHFPHSQHIKAMGPNACQTCHGDVARMPQVFKANNVNNMGFCITCHLERKVNRDCTACHY